MTNLSGIYIHIPFCKQSCHYCNFHFSTNTAYKEKLISCILKEIELQKNYLEGETLQSIYFGGGTPSLLNVNEIENILEAIQKKFKVLKNVEITLEANPDDLKKEKINQLARTPVNRLSIGVQSFFDDDLIWMNRAHKAAEALASIKTAQDAGFKNITIDLIYGIPGLTNDNWAKNLETSLSLNINHISSYALTVEPKTALHSFIEKGKYLNVNEEQSSEQFEILINTLESNNFEQYEISNFARNKNYALHNSNYWKNKKYLGIGPSAHSYNSNSRSWNVSNNQLYIKSIEANKINCETEVLTIQNRFNEYVMTGLRTMWGCNLNYIEKEFGAEKRSKLNDKAKGFFDRKLITEKNETLFLTKKGKLFADGIASELFL